MSEVERIELGCHGHLCVASLCRWSRHTRVLQYRISTIGNYIPPALDGFFDGETREEIGHGRLFETMVFRLLPHMEDPDSEGCGCGVVADLSELDMAGYKTAGEANSGHEEMVAKYMEIARQEVI